jgi:hypothetical protein
MTLDDPSWKALAFDIRSHPYFKRLAYISQLGTLDVVLQVQDPLRCVRYRGTTRYEHCMEASFTARRLGARLEATAITGVHAYHTFVLEAATALHDVGHGPFSHEFDNFLERRMPNALTHEERSVRLALVILRACHAKSRTWRRLLPNGVDMLHVHVAALILGQSSPGLPGVLKFLINAPNTSTCDLDRLDYLQRDARALLPPYMSRWCRVLCHDAIHNASVSADGQTFFFEPTASQTLLGLRSHMFQCFYKLTNFNSDWMDICFLRFMGAPGGIKWRCLELASEADADDYCRLFQEQSILRSLYTRY